MSAMESMLPSIDHIKKGEVNLGTSIMAVTFEGGVVLGADSRTTMGAFIANRVTNKLAPIHDRIYCCRSGSAADTQAISDIVSYYAQMAEMQRQKAPSVHTVATLFNKMIYSNKDRLTAGIIVAGYDDVHGSSVYSIPVGGGLFKQKWAIGGSGSSFIYGYCDANWREGWDKQQTAKFVRDALALAMERDGSSGGTIRLAIITKEGVERVFVPGNELPTFDGHVIGGNKRSVTNSVYPE